MKNNGTTIIDILIVLLTIGLIIIVRRILTIYVPIIKTNGLKSVLLKIWLGP